MIDKASDPVDTGRAMAPSDMWNRIKTNETIQICWCAFGIVGCLMLYGVLQERIMTEPFGEGAAAEMFKYSLFLVLFNRLSSCAVAVAALLASGKISELKPVAPIYTYAIVSISNVVATTCQYEALKYVSFPVQTLGKCAKMMPVMVWGIIILRKRYTVKDFGMAIAITVGCTVFLLTGEVKSKAASSMFDSSIYGVLLMLGYLLFDGFTSTFQDRLFKGYNMTTYNQILYTTLFSSIFSLFALFSSGQLPLAFTFVEDHPEALWQIMTLSASATIGALFISYTIKTYGSLVFATIMTTRQFLSILLSCVLFAHPLSGGQWLGTLMVFLTLYYQSFSKSNNNQGHSKAPHGTDEKEDPPLKGSGVTKEQEEPLLGEAYDMPPPAAPGVAREPQLAASFFKSASNNA